MVSMPSAAQQAAESDKRRKQTTQQTMEKVKANHLTRQLQMRLQYARLKVEHGWQKQNLNEVENLYFHNSHLRGPKPFITATSTPMIIATQPPMEVQFPPETSQSLSSYSLETPNPASGFSPEVSHGSESMAAPGILVDPQPTTIPSPRISTTFNNLTIRPKSPIDAATMVVDNQITTLPIATQVEQPPVQNHPVVAQTRSVTLVAPSSASSFPVASQTSSVVPASPSSSNHYPSIKPPRSRTSKHPAGPKGAHQNLTTKDMVDFASTSALTYDSFWSSHSGTMTASRSSRPDMIAPPGVATAFQNSGPFIASSSGLPDFSRIVDPSPFASIIPVVSSAHPVQATPNLEQTRSLGGLTQ